MAHDHQHEVRQVLWSGLAIDCGLSALKIVTGALGQSSALVADGVHSLSDLISSLIVMVGFHIAFKPADESHPYGHGRAETIAGWLVALILLALGVGIGAKAVINLAAGKITAPHHYTLWVVILSIGVKEGLFRYKMRLGKKIQSQS